MNPTSFPTDLVYIKNQCELQVLEYLAERDPARDLLQALVDPEHWTLPQTTKADLVRKYGRTGWTVGQALAKARF